VSLEYWYMFPIAILIATIAMASGVGGATFFAPILLLGLKLPPEIAIGVGLITEVFGFTSGLIAYVRRQLVDYQLARGMLVFSIPLAVAGVVASRYVEPDILKAILGMGLMAVAFSLLRAPGPSEISLLDKEIEEAHSVKTPETCITSVTGEKFCYTACEKTLGMLVASIGGFFMGMISTGLGELNSYFLLQRCRVPSKVAVATSVFAVAFTSLAAAIGHLMQFLSAGGNTMQIVMSLVIFTAPGVVIGGQLGPLLATRISQHALEKLLGILFVIVSLLTIGQLIFKQL